MPNNGHAATDRGGDAPKTKIFISYSRKDMVFVDRLEAALKRNGFEPLIDRAEIYAFEEWWKRIQALIAKADTVIFVLSPDAAASEVCAKEVAFAASLNKRFAPVVSRRVDNKRVPEALSRLNFIYFDNEAHFDDSLMRLCDALITNIEWIRKHTTIGERSRPWDLAGRPDPSGLMLRPPELQEAEGWVTWRPNGAPEPTEAVRAYIAASRAAYEQELMAKKADVDRYLAAQSRFLSDRSLSSLAEGNHVTALLLALEALPQFDSPSELVRSRPLVPEAFSTLIQALIAGFVRQNASEGFVDCCVYSHDGALRLSVENNVAILAETDRTTLNPTIATAIQLVGHTGAVLNAAFSSDRSLVATASKDHTAAIWDVRSGEKLVSCIGHADQVTGVVFTPSKRHLLTLSLDGTGRVWSVEDGSQVASFPVDSTSPLVGFRGVREIVPSWDTPGRLSRNELVPDPVVVPAKSHFATRNRVSAIALLSPTSEHILTAEGSLLKLWRGTDGVLTNEFDLSSPPRYIECCPGGTLFGAGLEDGAFKLVDTGTGRTIPVDVGSRAGPLAFSADGARLATTRDETIQIWAIPDQAVRQEMEWRPTSLCSFKAEKLEIQSLEFCKQDHDVIAASGAGPQSFVFKIGKGRFQTDRGQAVQGSGRLPEYTDGLRLSPDGAHIVSFSASDNVIHVCHGGYENNFGYIRGYTIQHEKHDREDDISDAEFNSDGSKLVVISCEIMRLHDLESGKTVWAVPVNSSSAARAAFVLEDQFILVFGQGWNRGTRLYDVATGREVGPLGPCISLVNNASVGSMDGHLFLSCGETAYLYRSFLSVDRMIATARLNSPRALEADERMRNGLDGEIPRWCISHHKWPFRYPEDEPKTYPSYGNWRGCLSVSWISEGVERATKIISPGNEDALKIVIEGIYDEYCSRVTNNYNRLYANDDFTLVGEGFREITNTLTRLGCTNLARKLRSEYRGPPG